MGSTDRPGPGGEPGPIRVVVVDDHDIVVSGVKAIAAAHPRAMVVVGSAHTVSELFPVLAAHPTDIVLLDLWLADDSDPKLTIQQVVAAGVRCLAHTSELRPVPLRRVMAAGASGVVLKSDPTDRLLDALREVMDDEIAMSSDMAFLLATDPHLAAHLAPRELEALQLLSSGIPRKAVGNRMDPPVGESTVTTYLSRAATRYAQLGRRIGTSFDVVREAHRDGYLDL